MRLPRTQRAICPVLWGWRALFLPDVLASVGGTHAVRGWGVCVSVFLSLSGPGVGYKQFSAEGACFHDL